MQKGMDRHIESAGWLSHIFSNSTKLTNEDIIFARDHFIYLSKQIRTT